MKHQLLFDTITAIVEGICSHREDLMIQHDTRGQTSVIIVVPHPADYPKLVGKGGRIINAFKSLIRQAAVNLNTSLDMDLVEGEVGNPVPRMTWEFNPEFDVAKFEKLLTVMVSHVFQTEPAIQVTIDKEMIFAIVYAAPTCLVDAQREALKSVFAPYVSANGRRLTLSCCPPTHLSPEKFAAGNHGFSPDRSATPADGDTHQP